jgi:hypothetical protein
LNWIQTAQLTFVIIAAATVPTVGQTRGSALVYPTPTGIEKPFAGRTAPEFQERIGHGRTEWFGSSHEFRFKRPSAAPGRSLFAPMDNPDGYISTNNPWNTSHSAFFPNGITTAGSTNWIYGTTYIGNAPSNGIGHQFNASAGASHVYLAIGGGNVGIGTTSPGYLLDAKLPGSNEGAVIGIGDATYGTYGRLGFAANGSSFQLSATSGNALTLGAGGRPDDVVIKTSGNVGIGTAVPNYKLDVAGSGISLISSGAVGAAVNITNTDKTAIGTANYWNLYNMTGSYGNKLSFWAYAATNPCAGGLCQDTFDIYDNGVVFVPFNLGVGVTPDAGQKIVANGVIHSTSGGFRFPDGTIQTTAASGAQWAGGSGSISYSSGNVGIGTASPAALLDVSGGSGSALRLSGQSASNRQTTSQLDFYNSYGSSANIQGQIKSIRGNNDYKAGQLSFFTSSFSSGTLAERMTIDEYGNVGIGTAAPNYKLDVAGSGISLIGSGDVGAAVNITNTGKTATGTANYWNIYNMSGGYGNKLSFWAYAATNACAGGLCQDTLDIYDNGLVHVPFNLGVGTTDTGSYKLKVSGNTNVTGNLTITSNGTGTGNIVADGTINAKYQDVAEWVPSSEQFSAGTVVVLDSTKSNQVTSSTVSYDTRVAGVVSEQPGIALGERSDGKVLVATTGRVRVKVDATKAPIHIGDLLVTSDIAGVAMKSEPVEFAGRKMHMPGTLIGKALEPLEKGSGKILVLLSLQ